MYLCIPTSGTMSARRRRPKVVLREHQSGYCLCKRQKSIMWASTLASARKNIIYPFTKMQFETLVVGQMENVSDLRFLLLTIKAQCAVLAKMLSTNWKGSGNQYSFMYIK